MVIIMNYNINNGKNIILKDDLLTYPFCPDRLQTGPF